MTTAQMRRDDADSQGKVRWASGWITFAAVLMIFSGAMAIFEGISAIAKDSVFVVTRNYAYNFSLTGWGVLHVVLGAMVLMAGIALFQGSFWARVIGVVLASLSMLANFVWLPHYPLWAIVIIAIDAFIIWALCVGPGRHSRAV
ncbi:hypothetical protein V2S66_22775 [Streptomyces sp. V4-01]|uniref:DUF7144 domain-containing protein n=1 Tax=Actinacidiphila polyblastidii TaxID=3110430 RepID=A0ABU7PG32_9ACTN|nr:hypothetical protein [Streptomyces sp. V4-01]